MKTMRTVRTHVTKKSTTTKAVGSKPLTIPAPLRIVLAIILFNFAWLILFSTDTLEEHLGEVRPVPQEAKTISRALF
jgi:hypothetical protein